jgi:signal transduction histidine kinase/CheY-like chemotaxis protein
LRVLHVNPTHELMFGASTSQAEPHIDFRDWNGWFIDGPAAGRKLEPEEWPLQRACAGDTVEQCLLRVQAFTAERSERLLMISAAPIIDADGTLVGAVAVSMDIEDRVRAEEALKDASRRKDDFLAMLAHELRNPLAPIGAAASLLARDSVNTDHIRRSSDVIARQVQHMTGLINELLDVARVTRGLISLDKTIFDARRVVAEALEQMRPVIEARKHNLQVSQPPMPAFVEADHKRLVQVLANLLNNAAKFTPEDGVIKVELAVDGDQVRMAVEDNGIGMTQGLIDKAFDLFTQADRTSDRSQGGLGIGLALVRSLVALHGGHVSATSVGPGKGSRFTVCLPKLDMNDLPAEADGRPGSLPDQPELKILLVDDNEDNLMILELLLASMGHQVVTTSRPGEAMQRAHALRPDVCLLDIGLPEINGLELAAMFRADPLTRDATLMAMSGYGQDTDRVAAVAAGFDRYFVKPVDAEELATALADLGRQRGDKSPPSAKKRKPADESAG